MANKLKIKAPDFSVEERVLLLLLNPHLNDQQQNQLIKYCRENIKWDDFLRLVRLHRVIPNIYHNLGRIGENGVPAHVYASLEAQYKENVNYALKITAELIELITLFGQNGIHVIALKGPVLALQIYGDVGMRVYMDVDIFVHHENLMEIDALLRSSGYVYQNQFMNRFIKHIAFYKKTYPHIRYINKKSGTLIEVHFSLFPYPELFKADFQHLYDNSYSMDVCGHPVKTLSDTDSVLYTIVHSAYHAWFRLRWLCDFVNIFYIKKSVNRDKLINLSLKYGTHRMLGQAIILSNLLFNIPVNNNFKTIFHKRPTLRLVTSSLSSIHHISDVEIRSVANFVKRTAYRFNLKSGVPYSLSVILLSLRRILVRIIFFRAIFKNPAF
jgi:hypothetical protein